MTERTAEEIVNAITRHQIDGIIHPFTCGKNSEHELVGKVVDGKAVLVCPKCDYVQTDIPLDVLNFTGTTSIYDLIYVEEAKADFKKLFPDAIIEDANDDGCHEGRFSVEMKEFKGTKVDYLEALCKGGVANISLMFGVLSHDKVANQLIERLKEWKNENRKD